jgi:DNA damage-inducible protein 1
LIIFSNRIAYPGAQSTIMTQSYAQLCGIDHLIDKRFSGKAVGVGTGIIIGKIHLVDMIIDTAHFPVTIVSGDSLNEIPLTFHQVNT